MIISHRGRNTHREENTLDSFEEALALGADGIECDLRLTQDKKIVVNHDNDISLGNRGVTISKSRLSDIADIYEKNKKKLLIVDDLFAYIKKTGAPFFLEVKNSSPILAERIVEKILENNLWEKVYVIGFSFVIKNALRLQSKYSKLRVVQLINFPLYSYIRPPRGSYGVFLGWIQDIPVSENLFRTFISEKRLAVLKKYYERKGFRVMGGVINNTSGFDLFQKAGIVDIVTDNIASAVSYFQNSLKK